jgi:hypothetical protein
MEDKADSGARRHLNAILPNMTQALGDLLLFLRNGAGHRFLRIKILTWNFPEAQSISQGF